MTATSNSDSTSASTSVSSDVSSINTSYRHIIGIALPVLLANIAMPIQSVIDTAIVGHFDHAYQLAGMGLAVQVISLLLVSFNFLQYASSGLSAQVSGKFVHDTNKKTTELIAILHRAISIAVIIGLLIMSMQSWLVTTALTLLSATPESVLTAESYLHIRLWGIIAELMNYAFLGWFAGQGKTKFMLYQQSFIAICNIVLTCLFVYLFDMGIIGVALGTVLAFWLGIGLAMLLATYSLQIAFLQLLTVDKAQFVWHKIATLFSLNKDIFIRTVLLTLMFAWITRLSALGGDTVLAVNAILLQVLSLSAYALDGLAVSAEALSGQSAGAKDWTSFDVVVRRTGIASFSLALVLSILWWLGLPTYLTMMTDITEVYALAYEYRWFAIMLPVVGVGAYWLDGILFGLTAGATIRNVAIIVAMIFFPMSYWLYFHSPIAVNTMTSIWLSVWAILLLRFGVLAGVLTLRKT